LANTLNQEKSMANKIRKALVTGATSGLGKAIAEALAATGIQVLISGRDARRGAQVVAGIREQGGQADFIIADLASAQDVANLAARADGLLGGVDILVNNAGIYAFAPTAQVTAEDFDAMYNINVKAPLLLTARLAPAMAQRGWGRIINITTMVAHFGMPGAALYGSSKAALNLLTQAWAAEYAASGVTANSIAPGPVRTPGTAAMGEGLGEVAKTIPAGRLGKPEEIAAAVVFLASEAAGYVNGGTIAADGGRVAA
jgi:NAD(P)-dependent dehydrogenase (short-subunit alcohol dehydrogenase family)